MAGTLFVLPKQVPLNVGVVVPGAKLYFYLSGTSTAVATYTTPALDVAHASPVVADADGVFAPIYLDSGNGEHRVKLTDASDVQIWQVDNVPTLEIYGRTAAEIAAGVTPTDYSYPSGNVRRYGAVGDGATNDTSAIQAAIDYISGSGGGALYFPNGTYLANLVLKNGVFLQSINGGPTGVSWSSYHPVMIKGYTTGTVIDTPSTAISSCGIVGIAVTGHASGSDYGIRFRNANGTIRDVTVTNTLNEGILIDDGIACDLRNILVTDALKDRTRGSRTGAVTVNGTDHYLYAIEAQVGNQNYSDRQSSANRYLAALHIKGSNHFVVSCIGELSDVGIVVEGSLHSLISCRGDLNNGEGFLIFGQAQLVGCRAVNNSKGFDSFGVSIDGDYSGFYVDCQGSQFIGCKSAQNDFYETKYSFEDVSQYDAMTAKNIWDSCDGNGYATAHWFTPDKPPRILVNGGLASVTLSTGANTLDVTNISVLAVTQASSSASIDYLTGGVPGQEVTLVISAPSQTVEIGNTWYVATGGMRTFSEPSAKTLADKRAYSFIRTSSFWSEI